MEDYKLWLAQVKDKECYNKLEKYKDADISKIVAKRHGQCFNNKMLSGNLTSLYATDQIIILKESDRVYCFDYGDIDYLLNIGKNPYSKKKLPAKFIEQMKMLKSQKQYTYKLYPLDKALSVLFGGHGCPYFPQDEKKLTLYIDYDVKNPPKKISEGFISYNVYETDGSKYVYAVHLKRPYKMIKERKRFEEEDTMPDKATITPDNISYSELVYAPKGDYNGTFSEIKDTGLFEILRMYTSAEDKNISKKDIKGISNLEIKGKDILTLYRGLSWDLSQLMSNYKKFKEVIIGQEIILEADNISSWTTNYCTAETFAAGHGYNRKYGIVVETTAKPDDVIIDIRMINNTQRKKLYHNNQREVLLKPGRIKSRIMSILYNPTPIISRSDLSEGWNYIKLMDI